MEKRRSALCDSLASSVVGGCTCPHFSPLCHLPSLAHGLVHFWQPWADQSTQWVSKHSTRKINIRLCAASHSLYEIFSCAQAKGRHWPPSIITYVHPGGDRGGGRVVSVAIVTLRLSLRFSWLSELGAPYTYIFGSFTHFVLHQPQEPGATQLCAREFILLEQQRRESDSYSPLIIRQLIVL